MMNVIRLLPILCFACSTALAKEKRTISVSLEAPDSAWRIDIKQVRKVGDEIWVISKLHREPGVIGLQVISTIRDKVRVATPDLPERHFVIGKTWAWGDGGSHTFLKNLKRIRKDLKKGKLLHRE